jgi:protein SCO1/2
MMLLSAGSASGQTGMNGTAGLTEKPGSFIPADLTFYDENGDRTVLGELLDKPVILTLIYLECSHMCPQLLSGLSTAVDKMQLTPGKDYRLVTVSFDESDTPGDARNRKVNYTASITRPFPPDAWKFLTGDRENIRKITEATGIRFKKMDHGFVHPEVLIFISPEGMITKYMKASKYNYGIAYPISFSAIDLSTGIGEASVGKIGLRDNREPLYCFPHDPPVQRKVFSLMKVLGVITLISLATLYIILKSAGRNGRMNRKGTDGE